MANKYLSELLGRFCPLIVPDDSARMALDGLALGAYVRVLGGSVFKVVDPTRLSTDAGWMMMGGELPYDQLPMKWWATTAGFGGTAAIDPETTDLTMAGDVYGYYSEGLANAHNLSKLQCFYVNPWFGNSVGGGNGIADRCIFYAVYDSSIDQIGNGGVNGWAFDFGSSKPLSITMSGNPHIADNDPPLPDCANLLSVNLSGSGTQDIASGLSQSFVDTLFQALISAGNQNGTVDISGGGNASPSSTIVPASTTITINDGVSITPPSESFSFSDLNLAGAVGPSGTLTAEDESGSVDGDISNSNYNGTTVTIYPASFNGKGDGSYTLTAGVDFAVAGLTGAQIIANIAAASRGIITSDGSWTIGCDPSMQNDGHAYNGGIETSGPISGGGEGGQYADPPVTQYGYTYSSGTSTPATQLASDASAYFSSQGESVALNEASCTIVYSIGNDPGCPKYGGSYVAESSNYIIHGYAFSPGDYSAADIAATLASQANSLWWGVDHVDYTSGGTSFTVHFCQDQDPRWGDGNYTPQHLSYPDVETLQSRGWTVNFNPQQ